MTQWMPCLRSPGLSCTCWEENLPFFLKINFTLNNAMQIAIINTLNNIIFIIFSYLCSALMHLHGAKVQFFV